MLPVEILLALIMVIALNFYVLLGGADYGGGVWDLLSFGPRARAQRKLIAEAIGPIWEANHVWLILVIVILFTGFAPAFASISTYLHIPLTLMLVGIVLRGSAFTFRSYDSGADHIQRRWGRIFAITSTITPMLLGMTVGTLSSVYYPLRVEGFYETFVAPWTKPFPLLVGVFAVVIFAFLAATYLTVEADDKQLQDDFRMKAMVTGLLLAVLKVAVFQLTTSEAPSIHASLLRSEWSPALHMTTSVVAFGALVFLWQRRFVAARTCAIIQVSLILWGWALAQFPYLARPALTIFNAASPTATLDLLLLALVVGALLLFPSFYYLFRVFKSK